MRGSMKVLIAYHSNEGSTVKVTAGRITDITVVSPVYGDVSGLAARVIKAQSLDVDGISGATVSTKAVLKAIDNALAARP
jgi:uncharacterized protein with FMN-binding domain